MSPPVNNVPPLVHTCAANAGLRGSKFNLCSAVLAISIILIEHLLVHYFYGNYKKDWLL